MTIKTMFHSGFLRKNLTLLSLILLFSLHSAYARAQSHEDWCYPRSAARIDIIPTTDDIFFDFTKSEKELNNFKIDTVNPYGKEVIVDVGGLMAGGIELKHSASIGYISHPSYNMSCLWYDTLKIDIGIKPTIYIAREFNKGTCMHNAIMEHEMKHIQADIDIVNEYANKIGYDINRKLTDEYIYGPIPSSGTADLQKAMMEDITAIIKKYIVELKTERRTAQQKIDSADEYDSVSAKCKKRKRKSNRRL